MILDDRDQFFGLHLTPEVKKEIKEEALKRKVSMSLLGSLILEEWLNSDRQLKTPIRSNKRNPKEVDVPLPWGSE